MSSPLRITIYLSNDVQTHTLCVGVCTSRGCGCSVVPGFISFTFLYYTSLETVEKYKTQNEMCHDDDSRHASHVNA